MPSTENRNGLGGMPEPDPEFKKKQLDKYAMPVVTIKEKKWRDLASKMCFIMEQYKHYLYGNDNECPFYSRDEEEEKDLWDDKHVQSLQEFTSHLIVWQIQATDEEQERFKKYGFL